MPINLEEALAADIPARPTNWNADQVILYHLGVGAGWNKPTDPKELEYTYEPKLKVLPSFGVIPPFKAMETGVAGTPGVSVNVMLVLHGEQDIEVHRPIPFMAEAQTKSRIANIYDKGKAALIVVESVTSDKNSGEAYFTNRFSIFARGEGGFGGESGPAAGNFAPEREPDHVLESTTMPGQAILYRLSGDKNPLHIDPDFSKIGGFDTPILHGLCSYGIVCKAVVDGVLDGDVAAVKRYQTRFAGVVFPGETIVTKVWNEDGRLLVTAETKERGTPVLSNAAIDIN